jgi:hypothetical protein
LNQLKELKHILKEIQDLTTNLMKSHVQKVDVTDRLLSRIADRNDVIRINTIEWVLKIISNLENQRVL